jgi:hypothetical protein
MSRSTDLAQIVAILELLEADVLLAVFGPLSGMGGLSRRWFERANVRSGGDITSGGSTVPTIVPVARQNGACRANASQID